MITIEVKKVKNRYLQKLIDSDDGNDPSTVVDEILTSMPEDKARLLKEFFEEGWSYKGRGRRCNGGWRSGASGSWGALMLTRLIRWSTYNSKIIYIFFLLLSLWGWSSWMRRGPRKEWPVS